MHGPATTDAPFHHIADLAAFPDELRGAVVAIGNFDGVHRGHQAVLDVARDHAARLDVPAIAMTFEPHPRTLFKPDAPVFRLTPPDVKAEVMEALGLDGVVVVPFTRDFAGRSADAFIGDVLIGTLGMRHAVTGHDFHFGKGRQGSPAFLKAAGADRGFGVTVVDGFSDEGDNLVSSSRIRAALEAGDVTLANGLLGYHWFVRATVRHGDKRGRLLGFPTANMALGADCRLRHGIYAVTLRHDGVLHRGVASYGRRPTFDDGAPLLEVFVFDFSGDLYGAEVEVALHGYIRPEAKFESVEALVEQMGRDSDEARAILAAARTLSPLDLAIGLVG
ncbi:MAG TPA: bifunctional riboflavin kinase/FAD synthetase [Hyphomicrobiales bacterium]|nr:bifunctional riboflavin kinase/FAD synthetase [Hyphomicrobiales bacterium]